MSHSKGISSKTIAIISGALLLAAAKGQASVIAFEDFGSYSAGNNNLQGGTGGSGWAAGWLPPVGSTTASIADVSASPLQFTPVGGRTIYGGARAGQIASTVSGGAGNNPAAARQLSSALTGSFYVGYLLRYESATGSFNGNNTLSLHLSDTATSTTSMNFGIRGAVTSGDVDTFMARSGTGNPLAGASLTNSVITDSTYYLVAQLLYSANNTYDQINMWINPAESASGAPDLTLSLAAGTGLAQINDIFFRSAANSPEDLYQVGNLTLGTTWNDLVPTPEPGTLSLGLVGAVAGLMFRRRASRRA